MAIYLDSAIITEAQAAVQLGWLYGITTNPTLLANSGLPPTETYRNLSRLPVEEIYYQVPAAEMEMMYAEMNLAEAILGDKLVVKIPLGRALGANRPKQIGGQIAITAVGQQRDHGKAGVPLYLVYSPGAPERPALLPELLTVEMVVTALRDAAS